MAVALGWDEEGEKTVTGYQRTLTTWCPLARGGKQFSSALQSLLSRASIPGAQPCGSTNDLVLRSFALAAGGLHRTGGLCPSCSLSHQGFPGSEAACQMLDKTPGVSNSHLLVSEPLAVQTLM